MYKFKELNLPIHNYKDEILSAIKENPVVIITAETGAGKSTQVPKFLMEEGYRVVITQPRKISCTTLALRVSEEIGCQIGTRVGYRTAYERKCNNDTEILFCTDGLQLVREINNSVKTDVLIIDEVHEWNINIETLVAWTHKQIEEGWSIKVVLMSATLESDELATFYGNNTPIIKVPGRLFNVVTREDSHYRLIYNIENLIKEGRNVLVFLPGKKEIDETCDELKHFDAVILPLHAELDLIEQEKCFLSYEQPKVVVATNVAQTSITIPDIDAVVDSGIERRVELVDNIEGLYLKDISQADCLQRKGRAGRVKEGIYILCSDTSFEERPVFSTSEINRTRLDQLVLRLAVVGIDVTKLEFFHQPDIEVLLEAKRSLHVLGAMSSDDKVTDIGKLMAKLPVSVYTARMIVEANKLGVVDDVITIASILETNRGTIRDRNNKWIFYTSERESDLLVELDLWNLAQGKLAKELPEFGIFKKSFYNAREIRNKLYKSLNGLVTFGSNGERESIKQSCIAGMIDHLYINNLGLYINSNSIVPRLLSKDSVVKDSSKLIVGLPKDIQFTDRWGYRRTINLVSMITKVNTEQLFKAAPQLVQVEEGIKPYYNFEQDSCYSTKKILFKDQLIKEEDVASPEHEKANELFIDWLATVNNIII